MAQVTSHETRIRRQQENVAARRVLSSHPPLALGMNHDPVMTSKEATGAHRPALSRVSKPHAMPREAL